MKRSLLTPFALAVAWLAMATAGASATTLDLTAAGSSGTINGAVFQQTIVQPAGTGVLDSFVRLQSQGNNTTEQGYNTSARPLEFDENSSPQFTRDITLGDIPVVTRDGTQYRCFLLDIDEPEGNGQETIRLEQLELYTATAGGLTGYPTFGGNATLVYDLDNDGPGPVEDTTTGTDDSGNTILLSSATNKGGSGKGDMEFLVPETTFTGVDAGTNLILFSRFTDAQGGFEEWAPCPEEGQPPPVIPLPPAAWSGLAMLGAIGAAKVYRKVRRIGRSD